MKALLTVRGGYGTVVVDARRDGPERAKGCAFPALVTTDTPCYSGEISVVAVGTTSRFVADLGLLSRAVEYGEVVPPRRSARRARANPPARSCRRARAGSPPV